jgi:hypothetical protein
MEQTLSAISRYPLTSFFLAIFLLIALFVIAQTIEDIFKHKK